MIYIYDRQEVSGPAMSLKDGGGAYASANAGYGVGNAGFGNGHNMSNTSAGERFF